VEALIARIENAHQQIKGVKIVKDVIKKTDETEEQNVAALATSKLPHIGNTNGVPSHDFDNQESDGEEAKYNTNPSRLRQKDS
jgi:hypothetical protein